MSLNMPLPINDSYSYQTYQRQRQMTLGDLLLENRIIFLQGEIHDGNANELVMKLLVLAERKPPQGHSLLHQLARRQRHRTLAIYDTMQILTARWPPTASAWPPAAAAVLLAGGTKGKRFALPQLQGHDPPALRRRAGQVSRHRNPGQRNPPQPRGAQRNSGQAHRPAARADRQGHRPRLLT